LVSVDSTFFGPFSLGDSDGIPEAITREFDSVIASVRPSQKLFFRGTADPSGWNRNRYSQREYHRLNLSLAQARADWAIARARGSGEAMSPFIMHPQRGVFVYVATYEREVIALASVDTIVRVDSLIVTRRDTVVIAQPITSSPWRFGAGAGLATLFTDGKKFLAPALSLVVTRADKWFVTLTGGWRPMGAAGPGALDPLNRDRAEALASLDLSVFPDSDHPWWGLAFGVQGGWETVRELDEFLERAYGLRVGPRVRISPLDHRLVFGADFQVSNISEFGVTDTKWEAGFAPSLIFNVQF